MSSQQLALWLALYHLPDLSTQRLLDLFRHFGSPDAVSSAEPALLQSIGVGRESLSAIRFYQQSGRFPDTIREKVDDDLAWLDVDPARFILTLTDDDYPALLREIPDPPPLFYGTGDMAVLSTPMLAMVGTRNPSSSGRRLAARFSRALGSAGMTICSGLALGIDRECHLSALKAGARTVAVLGSGLERIYPPRHIPLLRDILSADGVVISEFPLQAEALPWRFPQRNRIVTGLSLGVLVVEAARRSGSLISARCAAEQGREVFTIPGSPDNPMSRGCHTLLRNGALLVETPEDILSELGHFSGRYAAVDDNVGGVRRAAVALGMLERQVLEATGYDPVTAAALQVETGLDAQTLTATLSALELKGQLVRDGGAFVRAADGNDGSLAQ